MHSQRSQFLANAQRLNSALGDPVPAWTPALEKVADRALAGDVCPSADGTHAHLELDRVDWTCSNTHNPEQVQMYLLRFHVLVPLASVYRKTGDDRYARAARLYIEAFLRDHPITDNWQPAEYDGATQYDLRVGCAENAGWLGTLPVFLSSDVFDDDFFHTIIAAARAHLIYLSGHVYPDRNIRATHGDVLLTNSVRLDFLPEARRWREQGVRMINDAVRRQVLPDGAHMEAAPLYHVVVMRLLTHLWRLAQAMPELGLDIPTERIAAMHDYVLAATRPDGALCSLHDTRYSAATGAFDSTHRDARAAFRVAAGLGDELPPPCRHFADAGQVFLRDHWGADATYLSFDATTRRSYHWHPSRNTITLFAGGRALLVDTGYPFRTAEFPMYGTRTAHHSTINLNGWDQSQANARARLRQADGYDLVDGFYNGGYWPMNQHSHGPGMFGEHHRTLLWIRGRCIIVLDHLYTTSEAGRKPSVESVWQLSEGKVTLDTARRRAATAHADSNLLMLFPLVPEGTELFLHEGDREPMRGWVPIEWGRRCVPAPMVRLAAAAYDPWNAHFATVLVPFQGGPAPQVEAEAIGPDVRAGERAAGKLELRWPDGSMDALFWTPRLEYAIERQHGCNTDASLLHLQFTSDRRVVGGLMVNGSFLDQSSPRIQRMPG